MARDWLIIILIACGLVVSVLLTYQKICHDHYRGNDTLINTTQWNSIMI